MSSQVSPFRLPKYRHHKPTHQAVVTLSGRDFYLGKWNCKSSRAEYDRLIGEWLAAGRCLPRDNDTTVAELARAYLNHARDFYCDKAGMPTGSVGRVRVAIRVLRTAYGSKQARDFGPLALQAVQKTLAASGRCRKTCNYLVDAIKRIFKWGVAQELVPETVYRALLAVPGLRLGRSGAPEPAPVQPVADEVVEATLPHLPPVVADMVRLHRLLGARPNEICILRPCDVDISGDVWRYQPESHKTQYRGCQRIIFIGPKAQDVLRPYLLREKTAYCFSPADSERNRNLRRREDRTTPMTPSQAKRRPKRHPKRSPDHRYSTSSYHRAITRACEVAFMMPKELRYIARELPDDEKGRLRRLAAEWRRERCWHPNQIRHAVATEVRRNYGLEAAQVVLGHRHAAITETYAERDMGLAAEVARKIG